MDQGEIRSRFDNRQEFETRKILKRLDVNRRYLINEMYCIIPVTRMSRDQRIDLFLFPRYVNFVVIEAVKLG